MDAILTEGKQEKLRYEALESEKGGEGKEKRRKGKEDGINRWRKHGR